MKTSFHQGFHTVCLSCWGFGSWKINAANLILLAPMLAHVLFFLGRGLRTCKWDATILIQTTKSSTHALRKKDKKKTQPTLSGWRLVNLKGAVWREADNTSTESMSQIGDTMLWVFTLWFICFPESNGKSGSQRWHEKWNETCFFFWKKKTVFWPESKSNLMRRHRGSTKKEVKNSSVCDAHGLVPPQNIWHGRAILEAQQGASFHVEMQWKDDSGSGAVSTAAKILDVISRLPGCAGEASDVVSAWHWGQDGRCSKTVEIIGHWLFRFLDAKIIGQNALCMVYHLHDKLWESKLAEVRRQKDGKRYQAGNAFICSENGFPCQLMWTIQKSNLKPMWKNHGTIWSRRTNRNHWSSILGMYTAAMCSEKEQLIYSTSLFHSIHWWSTSSTTCLGILWSIVVVTCKGLCENALSAFCVLANKSKDMRHEEVSTPCLDDRDGYDWRFIRRMHAKRCNMFLSGHNWKPDVICALNNLASHASKWNKARGKISGRLISFIHQAANFREYCHVGNEVNDPESFFFSRRRFRWRINGLRIRVRRSFSACSELSPLSPCHECARNEQQCRTDVEVIPLDASLRMDWLLASSIEDTVIDVQNFSRKTARRDPIRQH